MSEEYSVGYNEGYQTGYNEAIDELEQENRLLRARNDRLEAELKAVPVLSAGPITSEMANWSAEDKAELVAAIAKHTVPMQGMLEPIGILMKLEGDKHMKLYAMDEQLEQQPVATEEEWDGVLHKGIIHSEKLSTPPAAQPAPVQEPLTQQAAAYVAICEVLEHLGFGVLSRAPSKAQVDETCDGLRAIYTPPAAQPTPVQEPDAFDCGAYLGKGKDHAIKHHVSYQPAPVQEPVGTVKAKRTGEGVFVLWTQLPIAGMKLYTDPPAAQRQWVGLTDDAKLDLISDAKGIGGRVRSDAQLLVLLDMQEAKLKDNNS